MTTEERKSKLGEIDVLQAQATRWGAVSTVGGAGIVGSIYIYSAYDQFYGLMLGLGSLWLGWWAWNNYRHYDVKAITLRQEVYPRTETY